MFQNKIFLPLIMGIITCTAYGATTMNGNVGCDTNVFGNSAELKANWSANAINVNFYDETEEVSKKTCEYDGVLELPEKPIKPGYQFIGWKIRSVTPAEPETPGYEYGELCGIPNLDASTGGTSYGYYEYNGYNGSLTKYGITEKGDWATEFNYGTIYGEASCNATSGTYAVTTSKSHTKNTSTPSGGETNCWCRITGFTTNPNPGEAYDYSNGAQCKVSSSAWVFQYDAGSAGSCALYCAYNCARDVRSVSEFRGTVFGAVGE